MTTRPESGSPASTPPVALARRWRPARSDHRTILHGMLWVALFVVIGKIAGAAKEMVIAWRYGVSAEVDAYLFLLNIINWPVNLWFSVLAAVLVPVLGRERGDLKELGRFRCELLGRSLLLGVVLAMVTAGATYWLLTTSLTGLSTASIQAAHKMIVPIALLAPAGILISLFSISMLARGRHANTLLESVPAIVIAGAVILAGQAGIEALTWGTLAGFVCHAASLAVASRGDFGPPRWSSGPSLWPEFWNGFGIMLVAQALMSLTGLVDQFFAARLAEGALSTLSYAQRILALLLGLCATAVGRATMPILARAGTDRGRLGDIARYWVRVTFIAGCVGAAAAWWLAPWGVRILFERGAFTAHDSEAVIAVFRAGVVQIPFNVATVILFYALAACRQFRALTVMAAVALLVKLVSNALLVSAWGIDGIMFSTALMYASLMLMYSIVFFRMNGLTQ